MYYCPNQHTSDTPALSVRPQSQVSFVPQVGIRYCIFTAAISRITLVTTCSHVESVHFLPLSRSIFVSARMSIFCDLLCLLHHDLNDAAPTRTAEPPYVLQYARVYDSAHLLLSPLVFFNLCPPRLSSAPEKLPLSHELGITHGDKPHVGYWGAAFGMHTSHKIIVTVITGPMNIPQIYTV